MNKTLLILSCVFSIGMNAQTILNGSFENDTPTCDNSASNSTFNTAFTDVRAIGDLNVQSIMKNSSCSNTVSAQEGIYFLAMYSDNAGNKHAAINLKLSKALTVGAKYSISYYDNRLPSTLQCSPDFGISMTDSTFGTLKYSSPYFPNASWSKRTTAQFTANIAAEYITMRTNNGSGYICVDNFTLNVIPTGIEEMNTSIQTSVYPNPVTSDAVIKMEGIELSSVNVQVYDVLGNLVRSSVETVSKQQINFSRAELSTGLYIVKLYNKDSLLSTAKLMVE